MGLMGQESDLGQMGLVGLGSFPCLGSSKVGVWFGIGFKLG